MTAVISAHAPAPISLPISSMDRGALESWLLARGEPAYRAGQIRAWLGRGAGFDAMLDLPRTVRHELAARFRISSLEPVRESEADRGLTSKVLYRLDGGHTVESVVMCYPRRATLCISSQAGCPIGCPFCATGQGAFGRNLEAHEILDQALDANRRLAARGRRLTHVVFMGMGEPLANYDAVVRATRAIADPALLGISPRRMVISTSGLVPRIDRLAVEGLPVTLAISLHAARDELRDVLVPVNRRYPLGALVPAARAYAATTGRRVSYEWVLLAGVNDTERDAADLGRLLEPALSHINLIPFNPVDGAPYRAPATAQVRRFAAQVRSQGLNVTVRDTRGREADAACGQLRARVDGEVAAAGRDRRPNLAWQPST
ncbi:MAG: 23S rRNA (adenine(2503)-C(2))-methyltransferase RlmN [Candidatus Dormibacteraceae bacterium]